MRSLKPLVQFYKDALKKAAANSEDTIALQALAGLPGRYMPWTVGALRPAAVATLLNDVVINDRRVIVECGSGISTVYLARLVKREGGHIYTIDEDAEWARHVRDWLDEDGTADVVTVIHAPLDDSGWYDKAKLEDIPSGIDQLAVDGPTAYQPGRELARYPALPFFRDKLSPRAFILLDDIWRDGEQQIVRRWHDETGREFDIRQTTGVAVSHGEGTYYA